MMWSRYSEEERKEIMEMMADEEAYRDRCNKLLRKRRNDLS